MEELGGAKVHCRKSGVGDLEVADDRECIEAIKTFADSGKKPTATEGKSFVDTGVKLVTDKPVPGIKSIDSKTALQKCWG